MMMIISMIDNINPVIAKPLGDLNKPMMENIRPRIQMIKSITGIHERRIPNKANINPAVPIPLDLCSFTTTVVWFVCGGC